MYSFDKSIQNIINSSTQEDSFYFSNLDPDIDKKEFLIKKALSLLQKDIEQSFKKKDLNEDDKIFYIKDVFSKFEAIETKGEKKGTIDKLRTFVKENEINSFKPKCSKIGKFVREYNSEKENIINNSKLINETYNLCLSISKKINYKREPLSIRRHDIFKYLIDRNVSSEFRDSTIKKIEGDYLIFRYSERNENSINISLIKLEYCYINNFFSFKSKRKGSVESNKLEDISTEGIFIKNSASTYVFLCRSVTSSKFAFLETITILSARPRDYNNYIVALFSGEIMSNNDYDNRPFSSKAVLVKIKNSDLINNIEANNILMDHSIDRVNTISKIIDEPTIVNSDSDSDNTTIKDNFIQDTILYKTLFEINKITSISLILNKIKHEVDKHFKVLILKN